MDNNYSKKVLEISRKLKERGYNAEPIIVQKGGCELEGIVIKETVGEKTYGKVFYMKGYPYPVDEAIERILKTNESANNNAFDADTLFKTFIYNKEYVLKNAYIGMQQKSTEEFVRYPHEFDGIDAYIYILLNIPGYEESTVKVKKEYLDVMERDLGITKDTLFNAAKQNTDDSSTLEVLKDVVNNMLGRQEIDLNEKMLVVSNHTRYKGAGAILNKALLEKAADIIRSRELIAIPSSIHEWLLIDRNSSDVEYMTFQVRSVNHYIPQEDILSDKAYEINVGNK